MNKTHINKDVNKTHINEDDFNRFINSNTSYIPNVYKTTHDEDDILTLFNINTNATGEHQKCYDRLIKHQYYLIEQAYQRIVKLEEKN